VAGPSGVGKGSILTELRRRYPLLVYSVSVTTRAPRSGEVDGVAYHFITTEQFEQLIADDELLEWANYTGTYYGTPRQFVMDALSVGQVVLLEIDLAGARQIRQNYPQAIFMFVAPPSWTELERRLRDRGSDSEEQMQARLAKAKLEVAAENEFDHVIVNDNLLLAVDDLVDYLGSALCGRRNNEYNN